MQRKFPSPFFIENNSSNNLKLFVNCLSYSFVDSFNFKIIISCNISIYQFQARYTEIHLFQYCSFRCTSIDIIVSTRREFANVCFNVVYNFNLNSIRRNNICIYQIVDRLKGWKIYKYINSEIFLKIYITPLLDSSQVLSLVANSSVFLIIFLLNSHKHIYIYTQFLNRFLKWICNCTEQIFLPRCISVLRYKLVFLHLHVCYWNCLNCKTNNLKSWKKIKDRYRS